MLSRVELAILMAYSILISIFLVALTALATFLVTRKSMGHANEECSADLATARAELVSAKADSQARQDELRGIINEAKQREASAVERASTAEQRASNIAAQLLDTTAEKSQFQSEATRVDEMKNTISERDGEIQRLNSHVSQLEIQNARAESDATSARNGAAELIAAERTAQQEVLRAKDEQIEKLNEFIREARGVLTTEFKALSADALKDASTELVKTADRLIEKHGEKTTSDVDLHHQKIATLLKPVEETIKRLDKHVEESDSARARAETLLDDQMKRLAGASEALTNALRKPVVRGSWGEMTLENALGNAGLEPEIDYVLQHSTDDDEDGRKRTDAVINLPKGRKLIIDSKNLMETFVAFANSDDPIEKARLAEYHSKSLRNHLKSLSSKEYWKRYDGLDCVILFIPHDGMYHAAIQDEAELIREACERRVFVTNPLSLIPLLKAVRYVLDQERLNKSASEISNVGAELYAEISRFAENLSTVGDRLKSTVKAYNEAIPGLDRYIVAKSRKLKQLGSARGVDPELPEIIELEPKIFSARELQAPNYPDENSSQPSLELPGWPPTS